MPTYPVTYQTYAGSLLSAQLLTSTQTLVLSAFGSRSNGQLADASGVLKVGETTTIAGQPYTMLGSGTVQAGADIGGLTVPLGSVYDVILVRDDTSGDLVFVYPDGAPSILGAVALITNIDPVGYNLGDSAPLCFVAGTGILTIGGYRLVESLKTGDTLLSHDMTPVKVVKVLRERIALGPRARAALAPVEILAGAMGPGMPVRAVRVSQQHRIMVSGSHLQLWFGMDEALAPARGLVNGDTVRIVEGLRDVDYVHVLCERHCVLLADGLPAESLLPGPMVVSKHEPDEIYALFDGQLDGQDDPSRPCMELLTCSEAKLLAAASRASQHARNQHA